MRVRNFQFQRNLYSKNKVILIGKYSIHPIGHCIIYHKIRVNALKSRFEGWQLTCIVHLTIKEQDLRKSGVFCKLATPKS